MNTTSIARPTPLPPTIAGSIERTREATATIASATIVDQFEDADDDAGDEDPDIQAWAASASVVAGLASSTSPSSIRKSINNSSTADNDLIGTGCLLQNRMAKPPQKKQQQRQISMSCPTLAIPLNRRVVASLPADNRFSSKSPTITQRGPTEQTLLQERKGAEGREHQSNYYHHRSGSSSDRQQGATIAKTNNPRNQTQVQSRGHLSSYHHRISKNKNNDNAKDQQQKHHELLHQHQVFQERLQREQEEDALLKADWCFTLYAAMIRKYKARHGSVDVRKPNVREDWEQDMWSWLAQCRSAFREGTLNAAKARALTQLGVEGFAVPVVAPVLQLPAATGHGMPTLGEAKAEIAEAFAANQAQAAPSQMSTAVHQQMQLQNNQEAATAMMKSMQLAMFARKCQEDARSAQYQRAQQVQVHVHRRQQQQQQRQQSLGHHHSSLLSAPPQRQSRQDPDGATPADMYLYPEEEKASDSSPETKRKINKTGVTFKRANLSSKFAMQEGRGKQESSGRMDRADFSSSIGHMSGGPRQDRNASRNILPPEIHGPPLMPSRMQQQQQQVPSDYVTGTTLPMSGITKSFNKSLHPSLMYFGPHGGITAEALRHAQMTHHRAPEDGLRRASLGPPFTGTQTQQKWQQGKRHFSDVTQTAVPSGPNFSIAPNTDEEAKNENITGSVQGVPKSWKDRMKQMRLFFLTHGHIKAPTQGEYKELGRWLSRMRCKIQNGSLPRNLVDEFLKMDQWQLETQNGHALSKTGSTTDYRFTEQEQPEDNSSLFRNRHVRGESAPKMMFAAATDVMEESMADQALEPSSLSAALKRKSRRALPRSWDSSFAELVAFKKEHGHCDVKMIANSPYHVLGKWLASQRSRHKLGKLPEIKMKRLWNLGCTGFGESQNVSFVAPFSAHSSDGGKLEIDSKIGSLRAGDPPASDATILEGSEPPLPDEETACAERKGLQISTLKNKRRGAPGRTATSSPILHPSETYRTAETNAKRHCTGLDDAKKNAFDDMLRRLESHQFVFGVGGAVPKPDGDGGKLGRWLAFQRRQFLAGKLSKDRAAKLRNIGRKEFNESDLLVRAAERTAAKLLDLHS